MLNMRFFHDVVLRCKAVFIGINVSLCNVFFCTVDMFFVTH